MRNPEPGMVDTPSTEEELSTSNLDEQLTMKFANMMIGQDYPNVGKLVDAAMTVILKDRADRDAYVIGKDEPVPKDSTSPSWKYATIINNRKAAMRQRAKHWDNGGKIDE